MRKLIFPMVVLFIISGTVYADENLNIAKEKADIEKTTLDYIEGWYEGDSDRVKRSLHPDLAERAVDRDFKTGRTVLRHLSASNLVEYTEAGYGKLQNGEKRKNKVIILDVNRNTASVKAVTRECVDYLHLAKCDGRWLIVNVLWEYNMHECK